MATGIANTQNMIKDPAVTAMQENSQRISQGETTSAKVYHCQYPGSTFYLKDGTPVSFDYKGELDTDSVEIQKEFDAIADKPGCPIFIKNKTMTKAPGDDLPVNDIQAKAAVAMAQLTAQK